MYSIIDIETTGGSAQTGKITEIAIYKHDGKEIIDSYETLINPESFIPPFVVRLTGITNDMVSTAPKFYEVAKRIVEMTEGTTFIAHNASFDYTFLKHEFANLGYRFHRNTACTVQLSKRLIPGHASYSLGKLTTELGIALEGRHRAGGDALATVKLFELLLQQENAQPTIDGFTAKNIYTVPADVPLPQAIFDGLSESTGVYYLHDEKGDIVYIGKAKNIRARVLQHIRPVANRRADSMRTRIADISIELTGNELAALLLESAEIKKHQPFFNRMQRRTSYQHAIVATGELDGHIHLRITKTDGVEDALAVFTTASEAKKRLEAIVGKFGLCPKLSGIEKHTPGPCFNAPLGTCGGACEGRESPEAYNQRIDRAVASLQYPKKDLLIIDRGRSAGEKCVVSIIEGRYQGYGYFIEKEFEGCLSDLAESVMRMTDTRETNSIIRGYLSRRKAQRVIDLAKVNLNSRYS